MRPHSYILQSRSLHPVSVNSVTASCRRIRLLLMSQSTRVTSHPIYSQFTTRLLTGH